MKLSRRSAVHLTGRPSAREAQVTTHSSGYTKILEPNPPPTSGEMTRSLCSGIPRTNAAISRRWTCGFCVVTQRVISPVAGLALASAARGSMALGMSRWLTKCSFTTLAAPRKAASVLSLSPSDQRNETLSGASSWSFGAPPSVARTASVTTGSGS